MKNKSRNIVARDAFELSTILDLDPQDAIELDFRAKLNLKIVEIVARSGLTHAEVSKKAKTSRTRITAILNGKTQGISTDLLLRIIYALGFRTNVTFSQAKIAA